MFVNIKTTHDNTQITCWLDYWLIWMSLSKNKTWNYFDNSFVFTRASHPHPIVVHADGSETPLDSKGLFLGAFSDGRYEENQIKLEPEDRVFFFTDGCYEMEAKRGGHLSYKHFRDSLMKFSRGELGQIYGSTQTDLMKRVRSGWENEDDQTEFELLYWVDFIV